nr:hypothetical protein [Tanacetum cinerariifolium]
MIGDILKPVIPPGEDVYFITASGNFFLFALNCSKEVISINPMTKKGTRIPHSPLGPHGTSSWRRSGIKLLAGPSGSGHFRFLFAEMVDNILNEIKKPYGVMMGCLEEKEGTTRDILMSNFEGVWDIIWLSFDIEKSKWALVPLPEFKTDGSNMAGVTFSSGLTIT